LDWADVVFPPTNAHQRRLLRDKRAMSEFLEPFGVRIPRIVTADCADAVRRGVRELGTPVVVKGIETEGGGIGVRIVADEAAALTAVEELTSATGRTPFLQQFVDGPTFLAGGLFRNGEPVRLYAGEMLETYPPPTGPSTRHRTTHAPDLMRQLVAAMKALEWTGLAEGDFVRAADGRFYFMEINPRAWGSIPVVRRAGVDLFTPLHQLMCGESPAPDLRYAEGVDAVVFPQRFLAMLRAHGYTLHTWLRIARDHRSWTAVPWTQPRLLLHLLHWVRIRFQAREKRNKRSAALG
jgi:biotin carboxylase